MARRRHTAEQIILKLREAEVALGNAPIARRVLAAGEVIATPVLGGLHHRYSRSA